LRIDHITVAGAHLDAMRQALTSATNLPTEHGGPHANHATEMALVSFPDGSYLELIGIQPRADPAAVDAHRWGKFLRNNAGPCAFALLAGDLKAGIPERSGRTRPDGISLEWETAELGAGFPFLIRDITPRENRVFPGGKPTTERFDGVGKVVIGVQDLERAVAQYRGAFDLAMPRGERNAQFGADLAWFEDTPIMLAQGITDSSWLSRRVTEFGDAPCAFVLKPAADVAAEPHSSLCGSSVFWMDEARLGWRLGIETAY
jgi:hypothetical protein